MSIFTSQRERRLWFGVIFVIVAIYSTLGIAGTLTAYLRAQNLLNLSFVLGFVLIMKTIILSGLRKPSGRQEIWIGLGIVAVYGMVMVRVFVTPEERTHLIEYGIVATLIYQAVLERARNGIRVSYPAILTITITAVFGFLDEGIQYFLPNRVYDIRDVGFNALAGVMAVVAIRFLVWFRERVEKQ